MSTKGGAKLDSSRILKELEGLLIRHRAGLISKRALREELDILVAMQRAIDATVTEQRLTQLEDVVWRRDNGRHG